MDKMRAPGHFYFSPIACELRAELLRYRDESATCGSGSRVAARTVARLETSEQTAHGIADLVTESFAAEEVAVDLWNAGDARWRVSIHFRAAPDQDALRALVAAAAGAEAAKALVFERIAARDWVRESLRGLKPVAAGRFVVHGAHDRARVPASARRHRDRGGARVRHRPSRHHPRLPARARPALQIDEQAHAHTPASRPEEERGILDLGTGSGVLAIAAARALRRRVLATDIDPAAVRAARANARLNRAGAMVEVVNADGVAARRSPGARRSISSSPTSCSDRCSAWPRRCED